MDIYKKVRNYKIHKDQVIAKEMLLIIHYNLKIAIKYKTAKVHN